jgi:predicted ATPase
VATPQLREIRLKAFKSFRDSVLPVDPVTVLIGRNSSGKSNALDGVEVLSRLAGGEELADALDGRRREGGPVRGGSRGCAPHGERRFTLGCTVASQGQRFRLDFTIQTSPELRIIRETLRGPAPALESGHVEDRDLLLTRRPLPDTMGIWAETHNGRRGVNPTSNFRDDRLLTSQLPLRLSPTNEAEEAVVRGAEAVTSALRGVFHLDPVPHLMRDYVPERDSDLRRTGENLSAAISRLKRVDPATFDRIVYLIREVADERVHDLVVTSSELGDVMLALQEGQDKQAEITPAREMSDGLLRFIAVATALLTSNRGLDIDPGLAKSPDALSAGVLVVIEELENGLHPAQSGRVLNLVTEVSRDLGTSVMVTTHSPALLNALPGRLNRSVVVCYRDRETGTSRLSRLPGVGGYAEAMSAGPLGDVVSRGMLLRPSRSDPDYREFNRLLGIE